MKGNIKKVGLQDAVGTGYVAALDQESTGLEARGNCKDPWVTKVSCDPM